MPPPLAIIKMINPSFSDCYLPLLLCCCYASPILLLSFWLFLSLSLNISFLQSSTSLLFILYILLGCFHFLQKFQLPLICYKFRSLFQILDLYSHSLYISTCRWHQQLSIFQIKLHHSIQFSR